jgi:hypothetical protein
MFHLIVFKPQIIHNQYNQNLLIFVYKFKNIIGIKVIYLSYENNY